MSFLARSCQRSLRSLRSHGTKPFTNSSVFGGGEHHVISLQVQLQVQLLTTSNQTSQARLLSSSTKQPKQRGFIPRKAALNFTSAARKFCKLLLKNAPQDVKGIMLKYQPSSGGDMRMVFLLDFARQANIGPEDEGVSLEVLEDGSPKPPSESDSDDLPKLYIHHTAFMKVLGGTMDIEIQKDGSFDPTFKDREGNELDPNN